MRSPPHTHTHTDTLIVGPSVTVSEANFEETAATVTGGEQRGPAARNRQGAAFMTPSEETRRQIHLLCLLFCFLKDSLSLAAFLPLVSIQSQIETVCTVSLSLQFQR